MSTMSNPRPWHRHSGLWIALFALVTTLLFLGLRGIWDPDEGRYTNVALNMLHSGDWLVPRRSDVAEHWTKPPLTYWAIAASVATFGSNAFAARLPSALAHLLCVLLVGLMGRRLAPGMGMRASLVYAAMLFPFGAANMITTDYLLAATETLAVWAFVEARFGAAHARRWLVLMWAGFGLAFLVKGPPGLLPLLPLLLFDLATRRRGGPSMFRPAGLLLFIAIAAPWYVMVTRQTPGLMRYFLGSEVVGRIATDEFRRHGEWYGWIAIYAPTLVLGTLPWSLPLWRWLRALPAQMRGWRTGIEARLAEGPWLLVTLWLLVPLLVFCIARSRMPLYVLPLFAPIALAVALQGLRESRPMPGWGRMAGWAVLMLALKVGAAYYPTHKDARDWADAIRARHPAPIAAVLFVEDTLRYGVHLHLGVPVQVGKLSLEPVTEPRFNRRYDGSLGESLRADAGDRIWICKEADWARISASVRAQGFEPEALGAPFHGRIIFRLRR